MIRLHEPASCGEHTETTRPLRGALRVSLPVGLLAAGLLLTGCFRIDYEWVFRDDHSTDFLLSFAVDKLLLATDAGDCETELKEILEYDDSLLSALEDWLIEEKGSGGSSMDIA